MRMFLAVLFALPLMAQPVPRDHYIASADTTKLTIQQPSTQARQITFGDATNVGLSVYCASASTLTISWNGTAATATAGTEKKLPGTVFSSGVTVWTGSNVGAGTTGPVYNVPAGGTLPVSLTWFRFGTTGTSTNVTAATSNSCTITFAYSAV